MVRSPVASACRVYGGSVLFICKLRGEGCWQTSKTRPESESILPRIKSGGTSWVLEVTESTSPQHPKEVSIDERQMLKGTAKRQFRLSVFDGPHKGWYLSGEEPVKPVADDVVIRELRVVRNPKQALMFDYIDTSDKIIHK